MKGKKITATVLTILLVFAMLPVQAMAGEELTEDFISDEIDVIDGDPEIEDIQEENLNADGMLPEEDGLTPDGGSGGMEQPRILNLVPNYKGTESAQTIFVQYPYCYSLTGNEFSKNPDNKILGWAKTAVGSIVIKNGESFEVEDGMTLYAVWEKSGSGDISEGPGGISLISDIPPVTDKSKRELIWVGGISWRVIGLSDGKALLISDQVNSGYVELGETKSYCGTVYAGFTEAEQTAVSLTKKNDDQSYTEDMLIGQATNLDPNGEHLFVLSASEMATYFPEKDDRKPGLWWTRSPGPEERMMCYVMEDGSFAETSNGAIAGCRPAFVLELDSVLFKSAAAVGKSSESSDGSSFGSFNDGGTGAKKLTLKDEAHKSFTANVKGSDSVTVKPGGQITVSCKNAVTGDNEYVSAMLCDTTEAAVGYASMKPSSASEEWELTLPAGLTDGATYTLKVFNEQQNGADASGNALTDYASPFSVITLSVNVNAKNDQTITASGFTKTYGDKPFAIKATTDGDGTFSYSSDMPSVADVDRNGTVTIKGAGEANITITASETANYNSATKKIKITVNKAAQSITASDVTKTVRDASFSLGAKASGGGKLTYSSDNTSIVTVDADGTVTIKGVGKTTIKIDAAATANYKPATKTINVTVKEAPVTKYVVTALTDGNGTASASPASGATGTMVTITADPKNGYDFKEWTVVSGGVKLADPKKASTTFKIGSANVEVKALFKQKTNPTPDPKKTNISGATVELSAKSFTYKNKAQKPVVRSVKLGKKTLKADKDYTVMFPKSSKNAGTYKVTVKGIGNYTGSVTANYTIKQADNPLNVTAVKKEYTVKYSDLTKKNKTIEKKKIFNFKKNGAGKITYSLSSAKKGKKSFKKYFSISSKGKLTIKKGLEKGTYSVKINVKAKGNKNYKEATKTVKFTVRVKK